jgi:hypothetical protein
MIEDLEFVEEGHLYIYNGVIIPSVSDILAFIFPNKYKDVPDYILQNKAEYGSLVHELVEQLENGKTIEELKQDYEFNYIVEASLEQHLRLKKEYEIETISQEKMVCYKGLYAGRYDSEAMIKRELSLVDRKTTAELDTEYLSWQLSFYELASGKTYDKFYVEWLPKKGLGKIVEIERKPKKELLKKLEEFQKWKMKQENI